VVFTDYETLPWLGVYGGEVARLQDKGLKAIGVRLSKVNVPSNTTVGANLFGFSKLIGLRSDELHTPKFQRRDSLGKLTTEMTTPMHAALDAQLRGSFRQTHGYPAKAKDKLLRGGLGVLATLASLKNHHRISEVSIPNGRLFYHKLIEAWAQNEGFQIRYTEVPIFDPSNTSYFLEEFSVHNRTEIHSKYLRAQAPDHSSLVAENDWFASRQSSTGDNKFLRAQRGANEKLSPRVGVRTVSLFTSSPDEFLGLEKGGWECEWEDQYRGFEEFLLRLRGPHTVFLRLHPNLANKSFVEYEIETRRAFDLQKKFPSLTILGPSSGVNSYDLIKMSDLAVVSQSTIGLEAVAMGVPTISVMPNTWDLYLGAPRLHAKSDTLELEALPEAHPERALVYLHYQHALNQGRRKSFGRVLTRTLSTPIMSTPTRLKGAFLGRRFVLGVEIAANKVRGRFISRGAS